MNLRTYAHSFLRRHFGVDLVRSPARHRPLTTPRHVPTEAKLLGGTVQVHDSASYNLCLQEIFEDQIYRFHTQNRAPFIIDCGANLGMSVLFFKQLYPDAHVLAFEADPYIFGYLERNVSSFSLRDVEIVNAAVWDSDGEISFVAEGGAGGRIATAGDAEAVVRVPTIRLRDYMIEREIDFLKLDIEGAEHRVLADCADLLPNVRMLFIEYHSFPAVPQALDEILRWVTSAGFRYQIKGAYSASHPFVAQEENFGMDLQLNVFCYRS